VRLRVGIGLWILSWVPYGLILGLTGAWLTAAWTVEIVLGIAWLVMLLANQMQKQSVAAT
jgi:hypothetical protein